MTHDTQSEVIDFLSRSDTYGVDGPVERIDTHISIVFLAGDRAYKLKRAVRFSYLDYADPESRCRFCHAEIKVNSRTAPELYEGVVAVVRAADGSLALGGEGDPVDWLVVMKRFDQSALWDDHARRTALTPAMVNDLADAIADFHLGAEIRRRERGSASILRVIEENETELARFVPEFVDGGAVKRAGKMCRDAFLADAGLLDRRAESGSVRHCHGDLHLRNICQIDGRPRLFDAIEFSDDIAVIDVLYDLAFLIMDLDYRDLRPLANLLMNRYLSRTRDYDGIEALPLFVAVRAAIRAHVTLSADSGAADRTRRSAAAQKYLEIAGAAATHAPPRLVAIGGFSGSGKSTLARRLAAAMAPVPGAVHLQSDIIRKRLAGVTPETRLERGHYARDVTQRVYAQMCRDAARSLAAGYPVIADATFLDPVQRRAVEETAREARVPFAGLWLHASTTEMERRLTARRDDASDAVVEVLHRQLRSDPSDIDWNPICAGADAEKTTRAANRALSADNIVSNDHGVFRVPVEMRYPKTANGDRS